MNIIKFFTIVFLIATNSHSFAKVTIDSTTFEDQRSRVNHLLDERSKKFGEYDLSLEQKTGIFGLFKTKNDMQKSIDILQQIVKNDNNIFIETRKLLAIKDSHAEKYQQLATEYDNQVTAYMKTISKLQAENEKLRAEVDLIEDDNQSSSGYLFLLGLTIVVLLFFIVKLYRRLKAQKLT